MYTSLQISQHSDLTESSVDRLLLSQISAANTNRKKMLPIYPPFLLMLQVFNPKNQKSLQISSHSKLGVMINSTLKNNLDQIRYWFLRFLILLFWILARRQYGLNGAENVGEFRWLQTSSISFTTLMLQSPFDLISCESVQATSTICTFTTLWRWGGWISPPRCLATRPHQESPTASRRWWASSMSTVAGIFI